MGALTIAFDTTIVGALALPWVLLIVHLFSCDGERVIVKALAFVKDHSAQVPAGVLLFALTYSLGSAVSRIAEVFFNDDDLHVRVDDGYLFRNILTEDRILTDVYCDGDTNNLLSAAEDHTALSERILKFHKQKSLCSLTMAWRVAGEYVTRNQWKQDRVKSDPGAQEDDDNFVRTGRDVFRLEENALMNKGEDYTARLRELHDQVMVLRGAAFNGWIAFSLCLFAWGGALSNRLGSLKLGIGIRWMLLLLPLLYVGAGVIALMHHLADRFPQFPPDPPYMEFTLVLLGMVGALTLARFPALQPNHSKHALPEKSEAENPKGEGRPPSRHDSAAHQSGTRKRGAGDRSEGDVLLKIENLPRLVALSLILTVAAGLGWWATEVLYGQQVIYSYDTQVAPAQK